MIYNAYGLPDGEACALLNALHKSGKFHWEDILCELEEILTVDGVLLGGDFTRLTTNREAKASN